ncbi:MAG: nucleotidyltransferase family protein [Phycisphaeraceae bacterium]
MVAHVTFDHAALDELCRRWRVRELALFGSAVRDDFRPTSDVDVLVSFEPDAPWSLWDVMMMRDELIALFGRPVDLVEESAIRNPIRRRSILRDKETVYATNRP